MLTSLLNRWFPSRKHQVPHQRKRSLLTLESLEDRTAPALDIFSGAGPLPLIEVEENNSFQTANQLTGFGGTGAIEAGDVDFFIIELNDRGCLLVFFEADHFDLNPSYLTGHDRSAECRGLSPAAQCCFSTATFCRVYSS